MSRYLHRTVPWLVAAALSACSGSLATPPIADHRIDDVSRLYETPIGALVEVRSVADIQAAVRKATKDGLRVSIADARHSQGGQTSAPGAMVLDMRNYRRVVAVDPGRRRVTVESGATWNDVQLALNPVGLAVKVMQSSNVFTVGGSLSVNAHGRDPNFGSIIETVEGFGLVLADGTLVRVSRTEHAELFPLVIGGYGMFGVITEVELSVTENVVYRKHVAAVPWQDYPRWFKKHVKGHPAVGLHYARMSTAPGALLSELNTVWFSAADPTEPVRAGFLQWSDGEPVALPRFFLGLARGSDWGKSLLWWLQVHVADSPGDDDLISRNNAMHPPVRFLYYRSAADTDILQEYFVPPDTFAAFVDGLRDIVQALHINLLNVTVRYDAPDRESFLPYALRECFAFVILVNQGRDAEGIAHAQAWTRELVDLALRLGGNYYLPYQLYPSPEQIRRAYPKLDAWYDLKRRFDPEERFVSTFYLHYRP